MIRIFNLRKKRSSSPGKLQPSHSLDPTTSLGDDDHSLDCSLDDSLCEPAPYKSHIFQQRFHMDHPAADKMQSFSSFMKTAAMSLPPPDVPCQEQAPERALSPVWWSFDRDYDECKESFEADAGMKIATECNVLSPLRMESPGRSLPLDNCDESRGSYDCSLEQEDASSFTQQTKFMNYQGCTLSSHHFIEETILCSHECTTKYLQFKPTLHDDAEDIDTEEIQQEDDNKPSPVGMIVDRDSMVFEEDAPIRPSEPQLKVEKCFENIHFSSPEDFNTLKEASDKEKTIVQSPSIPSSPAEKDLLSPTLSNMVHPMNLALFSEEGPPSTIISLSQSNTTATQRCPASILQVEQYTVPEEEAKKSRFEKIRKKLASSFRSKAGKGRVVYSLSSGKCGMTKKDYQYSKSLLPAKPLLSRKEQQESSTRIPRGVSLFCDRPLSILLLNPVLKIFEIVLVDFLKDTTVGDALSKARSFASDEVLSEQKYVSLCNRKQELGAPMLPVSLLVGSRKSKRRKDISADEIDRLNRREMEARLLIAVPEGSTASDCRNIRRVLWKNPKVQRWWKQSDPFSCSATSPDDLDNELSEIYMRNVSKIHNSSRRESRSSKHIKYEKI